MFTFGTSPIAREDHLHSVGHQFVRGLIVVDKLWPGLSSIRSLPAGEALTYLIFCMLLVALTCGPNFDFAVFVSPTHSLDGFVYSNACQ